MSQPHVTAISALDLFRIGIGPSSSHTVGPMRAAHRFLEKISASNLALSSITRIQVRLYGSLSATGVGHSTDQAVIMGLMAQAPETVDPDCIAPAVLAVKQNHQLSLGGKHLIAFHWQEDMRFEAISLPFHPNGMRITAFQADSAVLTETFYSVGGGFVLDDAQAHAEPNTHSASKEETNTQPFAFNSAQELLHHCQREQLSISDIMLHNEACWRSPQETHDALLKIWHAMDACIERGLVQEGELPGGLHVQRRAKSMHKELLQRQTAMAGHRNLMGTMEWVNLFALAVNEENAGGGRVVTAPTNGAAGIVPAVLKYYLQQTPTADDATVVRYLLAAAAIGILLKKNASISGAEVGCQGEVGSACAMAAAGLAEILGGTPPQVENAAEVGLEHNLGLTCDPIGGLVQIPCIERNAMASVKAINAAQLALLGDGSHMVSLDQAIRTMRDTGRDMLDKYKETSQGGLAVSYTEC